MSADSLASSTTLQRWTSQRNTTYASSFTASDYSQDFSPGLGLKALFDALFKHEIPGPYLVRLRTEFTTPLGHGGQGYVYGVSSTIEENLRLLKNDVDAGPTLQRWKHRVVKQLRNDSRQHHALQVQAAYSEVKRLCNPAFRDHPNIVRLVGWGLCLDTLEDHLCAAPRMPLLILERADFDLRSFIERDDFYEASFHDLCVISLGIGKGVEALHAADIVHGDLKTENILIFRSVDESRHSWTAKLCDFGSAVFEPKLGKSKARAKYQGTPTWRGPEYFEQSGSGRQLRSLKPCDVFAYGLVVWALFSRDPFSPIASIGPECIDDIGAQKFFEMAEASIRQTYSFHRRPIPLALAELGELAVNCFASNRDRLDSPQFLRSASGALEYIATEKTDEEINRIVHVLGHCLNDDPESRSLKPWRYFDLQKYRSLTSCKRPKRFESRQLIRRRTNSSAHDEGANGTYVEQLSILLSATARHLGTRLYRVPYYYARKLSVIALSNKSRQKRYELTFAKAKTTLPLGWDFKDMSVLTHASNIDADIETSSESACYDAKVLADIFYEAFRPGFIDEHGSQKDKVLAGHMLYAAARIRSRIQPCCWYKGIGFKNIHLAILRRLVLRESPSVRIDTATFAWMLRGEIARFEIESLGDDADLWWSLALQLSESDMERSEKTLLLFERGYNIAQIHRGTEGTAFLYFLQYLESDDAAALTLCEHFWRVGNEESTPSWMKFYLTGRPSDLHDDLMGEDSHLNTALHDAIRASNYPVVEYLVQTGFIVEATDRRGLSGYELALSLQPYEVRRRPHNRILALLEQLPNRRQKGSGWKHAHVYSYRDLPLGWMGRKTKAGMLFVETSVESSLESNDCSITFERPRAGLLQDKRLALGERKIQTPGHSFYLDPLRFMRSRIDHDIRPVVASTERYGDAWYLRDINLKLKEYRTELEFPAKDLTWSQIISTIKVGLLAVGCGAPQLFLHAASIVVNGIERFFERTGTGFFFWILMSLLSRWLNIDPKIQFPLHLAGIATLQWLLRKLTYHLGVRYLRRRSTSRLFYLFISHSSLVELLFSILMLHDGKADLIMPFFIGILVKNNILYLGICLRRGGFDGKESTFQHNVDTQVADTISFAPSTTASGFVSPEAHTRIESTTKKMALLLWLCISIMTTSDELFLHRATALWLLFMVIIFVIFRYHRRSGLDPQIHNHDESSERHSILSGRVQFRRTAQDISVGEIAGLFAGGCCLAIVSESALASTETFASSGWIKLAVFVGIPLVLTPWLDVMILASEAHHRTALTVEMTHGASLEVSLGVLPLAIIYAWITGSSYCARLSFWEIALWYGAVSMPMPHTTHSNLQFMKGVAMYILYILIVVSLALLYVF